MKSYLSEMTMIMIVCLLLVGANISKDSRVLNNLEYLNLEFV